MRYRARKNQELSEHVENTATLSKVFAAVFGCENMAYCIGLLHDLGKYTKAFQDYLDRSLRGEDVTRGEVIHALQGAKYVIEMLKDPVMADVVGNVIASHHGALFDSITNGERTLTFRTNKRREELHYEEAIKAFSPSIDPEIVRTEILRICKTCQSKDLRPFFMMHLMTKALYSCLVDADRCDAAGIKPDDTVPDWAKLIQQLENHLAVVDRTSDLDNLRNRISRQCQKNGGREQGVYTLSVPTGGGKTLSSLRFALEHAQAHNLKRIIYIIPYLSILDQTAAQMRKIFSDDDDLILEHHSNIELPEKKEDAERTRLLTARWDSPLILTTMVQFLETIYSNKASKLRKFHNMSEAVLIFDEIQSLPIKCVHLFNDAVNFLNVFGKSTILLCTATQPHLDKVDRPVQLSNNPALVTLSPDELKVFERVRPEDKTRSPMSHGQIAELVNTQLDGGKSTLVIMNTKGDARGVYAHCKSLEIDCEKAFLTTDLCPAHRLAVLERLRTNLTEKRPTLCVSTQLIEAGVDISFGCVIRAEAGLDSIVQAAGRCNRNNENPEEPQPVFVIDVQDENLSRLPEIEEGKKQTERIFREKQGTNMLSAEAMDLFYKYYFFNQRNKMDYVTEWNRDGKPKSSIYSLLNDNPLGAHAYKDRADETYRGLPTAFQTAAEAFSVIDGGQTGIVVPFGEAMELVAAFQKSFNPMEKMRVLRHLQKYTVNVYSHVLSKLVDAGAIRAVDDTFYLLSPDWYDAEEQGLLSETRLQLLNV